MHVLHVGTEIPDSRFGQFPVYAEGRIEIPKRSEVVTCEYAGQSMNIGFKGSSLSEILNNLQGDEVQIELADPSRAGIIVPAQQPENEDVLMLIMPMLLND